MSADPQAEPDDATPTSPEVERPDDAAPTAPEVERSDDAAPTAPEVERPDDAAPTAPEVERSSPDAGTPRDDAVPEVVGGEPRSLDPRWPDAERVGWRLLAWIAFPVAAIALGSWWRPTGWPLVGLVVAPLLGATLVVRLGTAYTRAAFRRTSWHATEQVFEIRRGVWWRSVVTIPRVRVQHTDVRQGPLQRRFGLATLVVHTAGTEHATVTLEGMSHPEALAARDHLLREQADDAV